MTILARGSITDRPWGMTLGALGLRGLSGQLTVTASDGKQYRVAFDRGVIIGAHSPIATDAAVRLALTMNFVTSTQVADITRRMAAAPQREEVALLGEIARLQPDQIARLRRRLVAQRAARTFSVDRGEFVVEDTVAIPIVPGGELDVRTVVFLGAKTNLSEDRLASELGQLGAYFELKPEATDDLPQFGFTAADKPALDMLVAGAYIDEIDAAQPALGPRAVRAIVYALASCGACKLGAPPRSPRAVTPSSAPTYHNGGVPRSTAPSTAPVSRTMTPVPSRTATPSTAPISRTMTPTTPPPSRTSTPTAPPVTSRTATWPKQQTEAPPLSRTTTNRNAPPGVPIQVTPSPSGGIPRTVTPSPSGGIPREVTPSPSGGIPRPVAMSPSGGVPAAVERTGSNRMPAAAQSQAFSAPSAPPRGGMPPLAEPTSREVRKAGAAPRRARRDSSAVHEVEQLLSIKIPLLDRGVDHFTLLGLASNASPADVRSAYFTLARKLHPDRLSAIGVEDEERRAQRLMAQVNLAFAVLNDPVKREQYASVLARGGEAAVREEEARADELAMRVMRAEEAFKQGEMALRRDQLAQAIESFQMAVELQPREPEYQALLAWTQFAVAPDKNTVANATRKALIRAAEANDRSPTAKFYLGRVERMLGREREALQHFQDVLMIKPNHSEAASEARILQQRLNKR